MRVLYIASGNPAAPSSGVDVVIREHIMEIAGDNSLETVIVSVKPATSRDATPDLPASWPGFELFSADDLSRRGTWSRRWDKLRHVIAGKLMMNYSLVSLPARHRIEKEILKNPDVIVVDHLHTLANVSLLRLLASRSHLVVIIHDATPLWLRDAAKLRNDRLGKLLLTVESWQAEVIELLLFLKARRVAFLSDWDMGRYAWLVKRKSVALCPAFDPKPHRGRHIERTPVRSERPTEIIFVGSPGFEPNHQAIMWLIESFAPELLKIAPQLTLTLIGNGTESLAEAAGPNVKGLGFVPDERLQTYLNTCLCSICPVVHGGGVKIKLLVAFASGCPVIATEEALRGFAFMGVQPRLRLDKPAAAASLIARLATDKEFLAKSREQVRSGWAGHAAERDGALCRIIRSAHDMAYGADVVHEMGQNAG